MLRQKSDRYGRPDSSGLLTRGLPPQAAQSRQLYQSAPHHTIPTGAWVQGSLQRRTRRLRAPFPELPLPDKQLPMYLSRNISRSVEQRPPRARKLRPATFRQTGPRPAAGDHRNRSMTERPGRISIRERRDEHHSRNIVRARCFHASRQRDANRQPDAIINVLRHEQELRKLLLPTGNCLMGRIRFQGGKQLASIIKPLPNCRQIPFEHSGGGDNFERHSLPDRSFAPTAKCRHARLGRHAGARQNQNVLGLREAIAKRVRNQRMSDSLHCGNRDVSKPEHNSQFRDSPAIQYNSRLLWWHRLQSVFRIALTD